ncbi:MAG: hypothetical protein IKZ55_03385 [Bacteroidales bacterium]|nr:hypothetical protein [Bacteroidales bacterium]
MKKKVELDTSFIWALKGLKQVGSEEGVDYYHVPINNFGAFVVEANHGSNTVDLVLTPLVEVVDGFVDTYLKTHRDDVCINLHCFINEIAEFLDSYKDSNVPYYGLLEMAKIAIDHPIVGTTN